MSASTTTTESTTVATETPIGSTTTATAASGPSANAGAGSATTTTTQTTATPTGTPTTTTQTTDIVTQTNTTDAAKLQAPPEGAAAPIKIGDAIITPLIIKSVTAGKTVFFRIDLNMRDWSTESPWYVSVEPTFTLTPAQVATAIEVPSGRALTFDFENVRISVSPVG